MHVGLPRRAGDLEGEPLGEVRDAAEELLAPDGLAASLHASVRALLQPEDRLPPVPASAASAPLPAPYTAEAGGSPALPDAHQRLAASERPWRGLCVRSR